MDLTTRRALLVDLDDTLYDQAPADHAARAELLTHVSRDLDVPEARVAQAWDEARRVVRARVGERASAHSRGLYLAELVHTLGPVCALAHVRAWEAVYWEAFVSICQLRPLAWELIAGFRARGGRVAVVSDQTLGTQLRKLEAFGLLEHIDALVATEEVPLDKPAPDAYALAMARLGVAAEDCVIVGDNPRRDGAAARALGVPYLQAPSSLGERGAMSLAQIARELGVEL
jgi:HAD superfamily hydrolase (TIGR01549 family)